MDNWLVAKVEKFLQQIADSQFLKKAKIKPATYFLVS